MKGQNVYNLNTPYSQQKTAQLAADLAYVRAKRKKRLRNILIVFALPMLLFSFQLWQNHRQASKINHQIQQTQTQLTKQKAKQKNLKGQIKELKDPEYLQQLLRSKYNYSKKGETIYNFAN